MDKINTIGEAIEIIEGEDLEVIIAEKFDGYIVANWENDEISEVNDKELIDWANQINDDNNYFKNLNKKEEYKNADKNTIKE